MGRGNVKKTLTNLCARDSRARALGLRWLNCFIFIFDVYEFLREELKVFESIVFQFIEWQFVWRSFSFTMSLPFNVME